MTLSEIEKEISRLAFEDKAEILRNLILDLEKTKDDDVEKAWLDEAEHRHDQLKQGTLKAIPAETVFANARERLENES